MARRARGANPGFGESARDSDCSRWVSAVATRPWLPQFNRRRRSKVSVTVVTSSLDDHEVIDVEEAAAKRGQAVLSDQFDRQPLFTRIGVALDRQLPCANDLAVDVLADPSGDAFGHPRRHSQNEWVVQQAERLQRGRGDVAGRGCGGVGALLFFSA